jgi:hypothetical protein
MQGNIRVTFNDPIATGDNVPPKRVQLLRVGKFNHPVYGEIDITSELLRKFQDNFVKKVRKIDLAIDLAHDSDREAAAWIEEIILNEEEGEMWARVNWTPMGQTKILSKEFRYLSSDFNTEYIDPETGENHGPTLFGAALTNRPFIKEMAPVTLKEKTKEIQMAIDPKDEKIAALEKQIADLKGAKPDDKAPAPVVAADGADDVKAMKEKLAEYEAKEKSAAADKLVADKEKVLADKKEAFELMLKEGKVVAAQKESYLSGDMVKFTELAMPIKLTEKGGAGYPKEDGDLSVEQEVLNKASALLSEKKVKDISQGIRTVLSESKELNDKYIAHHSNR